MSSKAPRPAVPLPPPPSTQDPALDAAEAYFYDVLGEGDVEEKRRAFALSLVLDYDLCGLSAEKVVPIAADIEAYLREGRVPGRGALLAVPPKEEADRTVTVTTWPLKDGVPQG